MKHIITLITALTIFGCQTSKKDAPFIIQPSKETISIKVTGESDSYCIQMQWADYKLGENNEVIPESKHIRSAPQVTGTPNQWLHSGVNQKPKTLFSKISYLIDGELVSTDAFPGVNLVSKTTPLDNNKVHVKGVFVTSRFDETKKVVHMSLSINAICTLGEEIILYEKETKFEPVRGPDGVRQLF